MSHVAIIVGLSGKEFFVKEDSIVEDRAKAQRFRSEHGATIAARAHIRTFADCIARHMTYRVEPA